ncbi:DUF2164 domain-containing protein [Orenia metallireducens]|uniref:DUF2164 domain-containing protein n=1 Tax=Orenia metallireducens TaxID=1413210 RepID=UPI001FE219D1|nr:DUF2164 domain-containing protein [Orenia metallireducens]
MDSILELSREKRNRLINEIQGFFYDEREEEIGIIAAEKVLDFFLEELGALIYNKGLDDSRLWFAKKLENIEIDYDLLYKNTNSKR